MLARTCKHLVVVFFFTYRFKKFQLFSQVSCETFCLDENDMMTDAQRAFNATPLSPENVRFGKPMADISLIRALSSVHKKDLLDLKVNQVKCLGEHKATDALSVFVDLKTPVNKIIIIMHCGNFLKVQVSRMANITCVILCLYEECYILQTTISYQPGDHLAVIPSNPEDIVDAILSRCTDVDDYDKHVQVLVLQEKLTPTGNQTWIR